MLEDPDDGLVARARAGDDDAFAELFRRHSDRVFRLALSILGRGYEGDAEDVAQEVFMKVHRTLPSFRGDSKVGSWIYRITFNHAVNTKARARFRKPHVDESVLSDVATSDPGPDASLATARRDRAVAACVATLPEVYQSALRLYYWMGASVAEIADVLELPENTVKSYLHRSRQLLDAMLKEKGYSHA
jgi:RNA polymerase sigma-70 factor (ECF subfamily)